MKKNFERPLRIAIVGRPNVGKSTLFNRLYGRRRSLVHDVPGVTRDRIEEPTEWWVECEKIPVLLIDTGGLGPGQFEREIRHQVDIALSTADAVLVLFDGQAGYTHEDVALVRELRRSGLAKRVPILAVVNKVDAEVHESMISDFFGAGFERVLTVSAEHGRGMDDLKSEVVQALEGLRGAESAESDEPAPAPVSGEDRDYVAEIPRIAIIGRPNVGKSTLVNALLGEDRMITSPIMGTTSDSVDSRVELGGKPFVIVDTAGIRRKSKTEQGVEVLAVVQARKALERADIAILLLDGESGTTDQDEKIGSLVEEVGCSVILAVNKWDTQARKTDFTPEVAAEVIRGKMAYLKYAPIIFLSALQGEGLDKLPDLIEEILHQRKLKLSTHEFSTWVREEATVHNPANVKFYLCHQAGKHPPTFVCHVNRPDKVHYSLKGHLLNSLRERWGYMGTPVRLLFVEGLRGKTGIRARRERESAQTGRTVSSKVMAKAKAKTAAGLPPVKRKKAFQASKRGGASAR